MMEEIFYLTKKGLDRIKKEYKELKDFRNAKIREGSPQALHSEEMDSDFLAFQEDLESAESRIANMENILKNTKIIKNPPKNKQNEIGLGATITLQEEGGSVNEFMIVGTLEANPMEGKISSESPVGKSLMGLKVGEKAIINSPAKVVYKVKKIKYIGL